MFCTCILKMLYLVFYVVSMLLYLYLARVVFVSSVFLDMVCLRCKATNKAECDMSGVEYCPPDKQVNH